MRKNTSPPSRSPHSAEALVGAWRLVRWEVVYDEGARCTQPFGEDPVGLILYTADGHMSACIMASARAKLSTADPRRAPAEERAAAFNGYFSYAGRYRVAGRRVVHEVGLALNPAMVGQLQWRNMRRSGRRLTLSASEPAKDGGSRLHRLIWERAGS